MPGKRQRARSPSPSPSSSLASSDPGFSGDDESESEDHDPKLASVIAKQALAQSRAGQAKQSKREAEVRRDGDIDDSFKPASRAQAVVRESTPPLSVRARPHLPGHPSQVTVFLGNSAKWRVIHVNTTIHSMSKSKACLSLNLT